LDVLTVYFLKRYMFSPMHFFGKMGFLQTCLGILSLLALVVIWLASPNEALMAGLFAVGIVLIASGSIAISLGLIAELMLRHFVRIDPALYTAEEQD